MTPLVRAANVEDLPAIAELFAGLSDLDRYRRFFSVSRSGPAWELERLTEQLCRVPVAVVAMAGRIPLGVATFGLDSTACEAELGVVVAKAWRRQGIATTMLEVLATLAEGAGVARLAWTIQADNLAARRLMERLYPAPQRYIGSGLVAGQCPPKAIALAA